MPDIATIHERLGSCLKLSAGITHRMRRMRMERLRRDVLPEGRTAAMNRRRTLRFGKDVCMRTMATPETSGRTTGSESFDRKND